MSDNEILNNLLLDLKNYDIYNFLERVSSLNLIPQNQNKCMIFDTIIDCILSKDLSFFTGTNIMGKAKFEKMVNECMKLSISYGIDPIEEPFIYREQFYGNKWIFSGITRYIGYNLQIFLDIIFANKNSFDEVFVFECRNMATLILEILDKTAEILGYNLSSLKHHETLNIVYPMSTEKSDMLINSITIDNNLIYELLRSDAESVFSVFGNKDRDFISDGNNFEFYYKPFLKINTQYSIILNHTILAPFLIHFFLKKAKEYNCFDELIQLYNDDCFKKCIINLSRLGHHKIKESEYGVNLINRLDYKELLLNVSNDGILFLRFFCDDGKDYNLENIFSETRIDTSEIEERLSYIADNITITLNKNRIYQLTVSNSFGRALFVGFQKKPYTKNIALSPFELYCLSVNESHRPNFIPRYIDSKLKLSPSFLPYPMDINYIAIYSDNNYSFYIDDDVDVRESNLFVEFGDSIDYLNKALTKLDKQLVSFPNSNYLKEVVLTDLKRNIYCSTSHKQFELLIKFKNINIWITTEEPTSIEMLNVIKTLLDVVSYWLSEVKDIIEQNVFNCSTIEIRNILNGNIADYYAVQDNVTSNNEEIIVKHENNVIILHWCPKDYLKFSEKTNLFEKELLFKVLNELFSYSTSNIVSTQLDYVFCNPLKKKVYALDYTNTPYLKPTNSELQLIPVECEDSLLYELGDYFTKVKQIQKGTNIPSEEKNKICNDAVGYLFKKLCDFSQNYKAEQLIYKLCNDLETTMFSMMVERGRYAYQLNCYPEKTNDLQEQFNQINKASLSQKFLLEYISAQPPKGDINLGEMDYEKMLSICSAIIDWANTSDYYRYKIIDSDMSILNSGRTGIDKTDIDKLATINGMAAIKRINDHSNPYIDTYHADILALQPPQELNIAYLEEFGFTFTDFINFIYAMLEIGDEIESNVKTITHDELPDKIKKYVKLDVKVIWQIIDSSSLSQRNDYLTPPSGFSKNDIWPWKFNRRLSVTRRPIVNYDNKFIWGNRQLYHCMLFTVDLINDAKLPVFNEKGKLKSLLGRIANSGGNHFNDAVADKLKKIDGLIIDSKVKKINGIKITDDKNQDIGDIDVLIIYPKKKKIIVAEVKDFSFTKSPYEMHQEYLRVFCDQKGELCYISKHKRRVAWIKNHIDDIIKHYNLSHEKWKIDDVLILNEQIISNEYYHINQKTILYADISKESINKI